MIRVVRLAGESFDLETGAQLPKALILSNGMREFSLHVDDETAMAVVQMMAELEALHRKKAEPGNGAKPAPQEPELEVAQPPVAESQLWPSTVDAPEDEDFSEEVREPGEEYNDPATGVGSL